MRTTRDAITTTDRYGCRAYVWADGVTIVKDGYGRMRWTAYRTPDMRDYAYAMTLGEALWEASGP